MEIKEAIRILRQHNRTGKPVLMITGGQHLEKDLLDMLFDSCERLLQKTPYISCKDALPENCTRCMAWIDTLNEWMYAEYKDGYFVTGYSALTTDEVSYWISLKKPEENHYDTEYN